MKSNAFGKIYQGSLNLASGSENNCGNGEINSLDHKANLNLFFTRSAVSSVTRGRRNQCNSVLGRLQGPILTAGAYRRDIAGMGWHFAKKPAVGLRFIRPRCQQRVAFFHSQRDVELI